MQGFEITLTNFGAFVIPSTEDGCADLRITFDRESPRKPWIVTEQDAITLKWEREASFADLDSALAWAAHDQTGLASPAYRVTLPCGRHFSRPGRVPAEQVLASMGWVYATHLTGFSTYVAPAGSTEAEVRTHFLSMIAQCPLISLENVWYESESDVTSGELWFAGLDFQFEGFILREDIELEKDVSFTSEGIPLVEGLFDFKARTGTTPPEAEVVDLASIRNRKLLQAA